MNIFLKKEESVKIGDLGVARKLKNRMAQTVVGTPFYLAPELCQNKPYNQKCDIWALGCILFELCEKKTPFQRDKNKNLEYNIINKKQGIISARYSSHIQHLIDWMLIKNPEERPNISQILSRDFVQEQVHRIFGNDVYTLVNSKFNNGHNTRTDMSQRVTDSESEASSGLQQQEINNMVFQTEKKNMKTLDKLNGIETYLAKGNSQRGADY